MEKKLPSVFVNKNSEKANPNNKNVFYSLNNKNLSELNNTPQLRQTINNYAIRRKINDIFSSTRFVYKAKVLITTQEEGTIKEIIISKEKDGVLTLSNKIIKYEDIIDIKMV